MTDFTMQGYNTSLIMRKPAFCICENKGADQLCAFVFATQIVQSLYFLNPKFQASSHLLWWNSPVCVRPDRKPRRLVFSQRGSYHAVLGEKNFMFSCSFITNQLSLVVRKPRSRVSLITADHRRPYRRIKQNKTLKKNHEIYQLLTIQVFVFCCCCCCYIYCLK